MKEAEYASHDQSDISISEMQKMSMELWELHKNSWPPMEPEFGKIHILYMIEEIGECIAIIKKKGEDGITRDPKVRAHFLEELSDVLMYYSDTLNRFHISAGELAEAYRTKFQRNIKRDYVQEYEKVE